VASFQIRDRPHFLRETWFEGRHRRRISHALPTPDAASAAAAMPPRGLRATLRQLGPGLIVTASIVGSGELIATPTLGSKTGFIALWLILLSCVIKVAVQEELGRYTIATGETTFAALDKVPGPRWRVSWVVWCWMLMFAGVTLQTGGIMGGVGQVMHEVVPAFGVKAWAVVTGVVTAVLLAFGRYRLVEGASTLMVAGFTVITVGCAVALAWTPYAAKLPELARGFLLQLPPEGLAVAFAVFGITGVGATELIYYPYWCLEKGYARRSPGEAATPEARAQALEQARGWIRVMQTDALVAMVVYTVATVAFFVLGAAVLHGMGQVPSGHGMVGTLSHIYTTTLGPWAFYLFLLGAFFVLYSTIFAATASNSRVVVDFLELSRLLRRGSEERRRRWQHAFVVINLTIYCGWFLIVGEPVLMVIIGGVAQACMLPIIGFSTLYLRYRRLDPALRPGLAIDVLLWISSSVMLLFAVYTVWSKVIPWLRS
jgi:Mn2+/Fe2+ NRAMP family transporter